MQLIRYDDSAGFLERAQDYLTADEAFNNLPLGICLQLKDDPHAYGEIAPYFATVEGESGIAAVALRTPPFDVIVYSDRDDPTAPFSLVARDLLEVAPQLGGVNAPLAQAERFASLWSGLTGMRHERAMHTRVYALREVLVPVPASGRLRPAAKADLDTVGDWMEAFHREAVPHDPAPDVRKQAEARVRQGGIYVWEEDGQPVSMAARTRPMLRGITVNAVYTPPALRGRGYATACVAALSQKLLDEGWDFCTLFTDMANPTSNKIYQRIGYRPLGDYANHKFASADVGDDPKRPQI